MKSKSLLVVGVLLLAILFTGCNNILGEGGPIRLRSLTLSRSVLNIPEINVEVTNAGVKPIKSFTLKINVKDNRGKPIQRFGNGDYDYMLPCVTNLKPGETETITWLVLGFEGAHEIRVAVDSTTDIDNNKWIAQGLYEHDPRYVKIKRFSN